MLPHLFVTVRFSTFSARQFEASRQIFNAARSELNVPMYMTFEQKGTTAPTIGLNPHFHWVLLNVTGNKYKVLQELIKMYLKTRDVHIDRVDDSRAHHLVHTFLRQMIKVGRSEEEKKTTRAWRLKLELPPSFKHGNILSVI